MSSSSRGRRESRGGGTINPFAIARGLDDVTPGIMMAKPIRSGDLLVQVQSGHAAARLMACTSLAGREVEVVLADRLNTVEGVITCDALCGVTEDELLSELASQGVVGVCRLASRDPASPNPTLRLAFNGRLPTAIYCGYMAVEVSPWVTSRARCNRCWRWGHRGQ